MKIVYERRLSDIICGVVAIVLGTAGLFLPYPISRVILEAFPDGLISLIYGGLLLSYHAGLPSGPCIVLLAGLAYLISVIAGPVHGLWRPAPLPTSP